MADFNTHLAGAAAVSGVTATGLMLADVIPNEQVLTYFILGSIGGLLPDIDSESSIPFRMAFNLLGVYCGFWLILSLGERLSLVEMVLLWSVCFAVIRFGLCNLFAYCTIHRGLVHSIPAAVLVGLLTVLMLFQLYQEPLHAWSGGAFVTGGFIVHLLLDECYSVDLLGQRFKPSFGSAFSLGDTNNLLGTLALYSAVAFLYFQAPTPEPFLERILDGDRYRVLVERLLPRDDWFDLDVKAPLTP